MLLLTSTSDLVRVVTDASADIEVHASWVDNASGTVTPGRTNTASITTATTITVVGSPAASTQRNVKFLSLRNNHASTTCGITIDHTDGTNAETLIKANLLAGELLIFTQTGVWLHYDTDGVVKDRISAKLFNQSTASQGAGFSADTYATGSFIVFPTAPKVGTKYRCKIDVSKTAAGTATPILTVRTGTAGTTSDTSRHALTFNAGTAAADVGWFEVEVVFRSVGSGTSAVTQCRATCAHSLSTTGLINTPGQVLQSTASGFDSTTAGLGIGVSVNGGTSASWTVQLVDAELENTR